MEFLGQIYFWPVVTPSHECHVSITSYDRWHCCDGKCISQSIISSFDQLLHPLYQSNHTLFCRLQRDTEHFVFPNICLVHCLIVNFFLPLRSPFSLFVCELEMLNLKKTKHTVSQISPSMKNLSVAPYSSFLMRFYLNSPRNCSNRLNSLRQLSTF